jgi:hypothetical protein
MRQVAASSIASIYCGMLHNQNTSATVSCHRQNVVLRHTKKDHELMVFFQHFAEGGSYFCRRDLSGVVQWWNIFQGGDPFLQGVQGRLGTAGQMQLA